MDLKSRIEKLENSKGFENNLEEWSRTMQYRLGISYGKGAPTSYMPAEEFLALIRGVIIHADNFVLMTNKGLPDLMEERDNISLLVVGRKKDRQSFN